MKSELTEVSKLEVAWTWVKNYWWLPLASFFLLLGYFAGSRGKVQVKKILEAQKRDYENQLRVKEEQRQKEKKIMEDYRKSLEILKEKHEIEEEKIKSESKKELIETIRENREKPISDVADDFAERFGLKKV